MLLVETRPLHPTLATEIIGLQLWEAPEPETVAALRKLWSRRGVLVFRRQTTIGIAGMDETAGAALLDEVYDAAIRPEYVYTHQWQVGDLVLWDNGFTMHRREPFDPSARRLMKRTTMFLDPARHIVPDGVPAE